jgi:hypothetical protein
MITIDGLHTLGGILYSIGRFQREAERLHHPIIRKIQYKITMIPMII